MITVKSKLDLEKMYAAGQVAAGALEVAGDAVRPGITTFALNQIIHAYITRHSAVPSFLGYSGFPASACISVNNEVIHGIPSRQRVLKDGDIVSIDIGACLNGFHGDTCATFGVGTISKQAQRLLDVTRDSLYAGIAAVKEGCRIGDIARTVQEYCESHGFFVVKSFCGHGIGRRLHEDPEIPNFGKKGRGVRLSSGMTIAIEPMVNEGGEKVDILADGTVVNSCGGLSAHFEHSVAVLPDGCALLTQLRDG